MQKTRKYKLFCILAGACLLIITGTLMFAGFASAQTPVNITFDSTATMNTIGLVGTDLTITNELTSSLQYDRVTGLLALSIPQDTPAEQQISLTVTGRLFNHEDSMKLSWSPFIEAEADGWVPGETYTGEVQLNSVDYIEIAGIVKDTLSNEITGQFVVLLNKEGDFIQCEQVPAAGNKDNYYKQVLQ